MKQMQNITQFRKYCIFFEGKILLCKDQNNQSLPEEIWFDLGKSTNASFALGSYQSYDCFAVEVNEVNILESEPIVDTAWIPIKLAFSLLDVSWFGIVAKGYQLLQWNKQNRFCGQCGSFLIKKSNTYECYCQPCFRSFFPKISPSIIVMIHRENKILMARSAHFSPGVYGLIAGFVEPGETLEDAVHREVMEEVGVIVRNVQYFGSQPWPFPDALMMAFTADYVSGELVFNDGEIESAGWYDKNNFPGMPSSSVSIASRLIEHFITNNNGSLASCS